MGLMSPVRAAVVLALAAAAAGCTATAPPPVPSTGEPAQPGPAETAETRILSQADAQRLLWNKGITLQWIDWDSRGLANVTSEAGAWRLRAAQAEAAGPGRLFLDGAITEIGEGYFTFDGTIRITDTPDRGRSCELTKTWHFAVTQNRPYYRLREFEWCDGLTDYIDIYY